MADDRPLIEGAWIFPQQTDAQFAAIAERLFEEAVQHHYDASDRLKALYRPDGYDDADFEEFLRAKDAMRFIHRAWQLFRERADGVSE